MSRYRISAAIGAKAAWKWLDDFTTTIFFCGKVDAEFGEDLRAEGLRAAGGEHDVEIADGDRGGGAERDVALLEGNDEIGRRGAHHDLGVDGRAGSRRGLAAEAQGEARAGPCGAAEADGDRVPHRADGGRDVRVAQQRARP